MWWHYIVYINGGFSISLRSSNGLKAQAKGAWNIARHFAIDKSMNKLMGSKWKNWKMEQAENVPSKPWKKLGWRKYWNTCNGSYEFCQHWPVVCLCHF